MTKHSAVDHSHKESAKDIAVNRDSVSEYLLNNPSFLIDNADLLIQLQVNLQENGVVSLTEIQASQSREKIKQLKNQLESLVETARRNEFIYTTYAELNLSLAKAKSLVGVAEALKMHLVDDLGLETANLIMLDDTELGPAHEFSEIQQRSIFDKKLAQKPYYFGRVGKVEKEALFPQAKAESVALILLTQEQKKTCGLLAIASDNPQHFQPNMDTVLLDFLRKNLNYHLSRLS